MYIKYIYNKVHQSYLIFKKSLPSFNCESREMTGNEEREEG